MPSHVLIHQRYNKQKKIYFINWNVRILVKALHFALCLINPTIGKGQSIRDRNWSTCTTVIAFSWIFQSIARSLQRNVASLDIGPAYWSRWSNAVLVLFNFILSVLYWPSSSDRFDWTCFKGFIWLKLFHWLQTFCANFPGGKIK